MMILRTPRAFARLGFLQLRNNLVDVVRFAINRMCDWAAPKGTKSFPFLREIHFWNRNFLPLDVAPDIDFGPIEQWLHAHVFAFGRAGGELSPKLRRLIFVFPFKLRVAPREIALFRTGRILV